MTDTQMVKKLVALEPDLDILNIEEAKIKEKISKVIHVSNGKKELDVFIVINTREMYTIS